MKLGGHIISILVGLAALGAAKPHPGAEARASRVTPEGKSAGVLTPPGNSLTGRTAWDKKADLVRRDIEKPLPTALGRTVPECQQWKLRPPAAGTREPVTLSFPQRALPGHLIEVRDRCGNRIAGQGVITACESQWRFKPTAPWRVGTYHVYASALRAPKSNPNRREKVALPFEVKAKSKHSALRLMRELPPL
jgi:hypothetical protein